MKKRIRFTFLILQIINENLKIQVHFLKLQSPKVDSFVLVKFHPMAKKYRYYVRKLTKVDNDEGD